MPHTPGPWVVNAEYPFVIWGQDGPGHGAIADVSPHGTPQMQEEINRMTADVHLISAAPDLLEALIELSEAEIIAGSAERDRAIDKACAAIDKAEGR